MTPHGWSSAGDPGDPRWSPGDSRTLPSSPEWSGLTTIDLKRGRYATDSHFRLGWREWQDHPIGQTALLWRTTALVLKPEAMAGRRSALILERTAALGFQPVLAVPTTFGEAAVHATWRYQMDGASDDWIRLRSCYCLDTPALYVALIHPEAGPTSSAAHRLRQAKGSPHLDQQKQTDLRAGLGAPNPVLSFLHTPDDGADFIRESTIWLDHTHRERLRDDALRGHAVPWPEILNLARRIEHQIPMKSFDPTVADLALRTLVASRREVDCSAARDLLGLLEAPRSDGFHLRRFEDLLRCLDIEPTQSWDVFTAASQRIALRVPSLLGSPYV